MIETFKYFNHLIFKDAIRPLPKFVVYDSKVNAGYFIGESGEGNKPRMKIKISKRFNRTYQDFCETLVHEMVHCFQFLNRMPVDHDKAFNEMAKVIRRGTGLEIR